MQDLVFSSEGHDIHGVLRETIQPSGRAIIFCHGAFDYQRNWSDYAERFNREGWTTFTFDFTGHGQSQGLRNLVDVRIWTYNIRDGMNFLQSKGYKNFALIGWDIGGCAALLTAAHDQRLSSAVILATPVQLVPDIGERVAFALATGFSRLKKAILKKPFTLSRLNELNDLLIAEDETVNAGYKADPQIRSSYQEVPIPESLDYLWLDITGALDKIKTPVLILHGEEDAIVSKKQSQKLYDHLRCPKELVWIEGSGHALHLDRKQNDVYRHTSKWIKKHHE